VTFTVLPARGAMRTWCVSCRKGCCAAVWSVSARTTAAHEGRAAMRYPATTRSPGFSSLFACGNAAWQSSHGSGLPSSEVPSGSPGWSVGLNSSASKQSWQPAVVRSAKCSARPRWRTAMTSPRTTPCAAGGAAAAIGRGSSGLAGLLMSAGDEPARATRPGSRVRVAAARRPPLSYSSPARIALPGPWVPLCAAYGAGAAPAAPAPAPAPAPAAQHQRHQHQRGQAWRPPARRPALPAWPTVTATFVDTQSQCSHRDLRYDRCTVSKYSNQVTVRNCTVCKIVLSTAIQLPVCMLKYFPWGILPSICAYA
jgi:hypothetical protein